MSNQEINLPSNIIEAMYNETLCRQTPIEYKIYELREEGKYGIEFHRVDDLPMLYQTESRAHVDLVKYLETNERARKRMYTIKGVIKPM